MSDSIFNNLVKKVSKYRWTLISTDRIKKIMQNILGDEYWEKKIYKMIYFLKNRKWWYLISLKKDIFYVKEPQDSITEEEIIEKHYWTVLKKHCKEYLNNSRYIWWIKALQLNMMDYSIPDEIDIINPLKQSKEVVLSKKYIKYKKYSSKNISIFNKLKKFTDKVNIWKNSFYISKIELAMLESLYNPDIVSERYIQEVIKKLLRRNKKQLDYDTIMKIIRLGKHHTSINRLYNLAKAIDPEISSKLWDIIKKYSFFLEI